LTEQQKTSQIAGINEQIDQLREQTRGANAQIKKYIEKRDQLHQEVRQAHEEINQLKTQRDDLNEKVKTLKQQRDAVRANITPITDEVNALDEKITEQKKKLPRISQRELQTELDAIEWKIQTTSLDLKEENRLIENVKQLEIQLSGYKKIDKYHKKINELIAHRKTFDAQADAYHKELTELALKSQELHAIMMEKLNATKIKRKEADSLHQSFIKLKEQNAPMYEKIRELTEQLKSLRASLKEEDKAKRIVAEQAIKEKLGSQAREKLQKGEKLNWDEFQLLMGDNEQDDSETQD
jgi:uncharacterized coiled-coil DUF342 family protein